MFYLSKTLQNTLFQAKYLAKTKRSHKAKFIFPPCVCDIFIWSLWAQFIFLSAMTFSPAKEVQTFTMFHEGNKKVHDVSRSFWRFKKVQEGSPNPPQHHWWHHCLLWGRGKPLSLSNFGFLYHHCNLQMWVHGSTSQPRRGRWGGGAHWTKIMGNSTLINKSSKWWCK